MDILFTLVLVLLATAALLGLGRWSQIPLLKVSRLPYVNSQVAYQGLLLVVALVVLLLLYGYKPNQLANYLALGNPAGAAQGVAWLGIAPGESWLSLGASLSFFITLATFGFMYLQFRKSGLQLRHLLLYWPWILLFSINNSFCEEVIYRLGVVVPLAGGLEVPAILLFSAIAFGAPHLRGMPNGVVGALMAGILGWLLAKSVLETNGLFWAWFIHFLQDVVIFSALVMVAAKSAHPPQRGGTAKTH